MQTDDGPARRGSAVDAAAAARSGRARAPFGRRCAVPPSRRTQVAQALRRCAPGLGAALCLAAWPAQATPERRNWFGDPFFQASAALPGCPLPMGPWLTAQEKLEQSHHRAERGTTCWLAGQCKRPNAYAYDHDIARALRAALARHRRLLAAATLWVTVQGRVVYIEGCASDRGRAAALERLAHGVADVQQAVALLRTDPAAPVPYRTREPQAAAH